MAEEKLSKKTDVRTYEFVNAIKPGLPRNTSYDEAWQVLVDNCKIGGSLGTVDTRAEQTTTFKLYKNMEGDDGEFVYEFNWPNKDAWESNYGDWNWTFIFKTVIEYIIEHKVVKKPRAKRSDAGKARKSPVKSNEKEESSKCKATTKNSVKSKENKVKSKVNK